MRILITNDDGINSDGIVRLAKAAKEFGEVWVVAPETQRSAASHSITLHSAIDIYPCEDFPIDGVHAYYCSGTPGDCVRVGGLNVMPKKPDLVLSGINFGYNVASDIQYSATCGAAFEAAFQGYHAIALSEGACDCHEVTDKYIKQVFSRGIHLLRWPLQGWRPHYETYRGVVQQERDAHLPWQGQVPRQHPRRCRCGSARCLRNRLGFVEREMISSETLTAI